MASLMALLQHIELSVHSVLPDCSTRNYARFCRQAGSICVHVVRDTIRLSQRPARSAIRPFWYRMCLLHQTMQPLIQRCSWCLEHFETSTLPWLLYDKVTGKERHLPVSDTILKAKYLGYWGWVALVETWSKKLKRSEWPQYITTGESWIQKRPEVPNMSHSKSCWRRAMSFPWTYLWIRRRDTSSQPMSLSWWNQAVSS